MTILHHPSDELLEAYAAGALDEGQRIAIAAHLSLCPACSRWERTLERIAGAMLEELPPTDLRADLLPDLTHRSMDVDEPRTIRNDVTTDVASLPGFLRRRRFRNWRWVGPGVHVRPLEGVEGETRVFLLRSSPGSRMLQHSHTGIEMTCVLSGAFSHEGGRFGPGDFDFGDDDVEHQPMVEAGEPCVCLVAMTGGLRLSGMLGRLMQPLVRI